MTARLSMGRTAAWAMPAAPADARRTVASERARVAARSLSAADRRSTSLRTITCISGAALISTRVIFKQTWFACRKSKVTRYACSEEQ